MGAGEVQPGDDEEGFEGLSMGVRQLMGMRREVGRLRAQMRRRSSGGSWEKRC